MEGRTATQSLGRFQQLLGFGVGALPSLLTGGITVERIFLSPHGAPDRVMDWAVFVVGSLVLPGLASVSLERRCPQFARGLVGALVLIACPLNVMIVVGLLGMSWSQ
jgi:hypothetical protein